MKALIKLKIKENLNKTSFLFFAIIGGLISLFVISSITFTTNSPELSSEYQQYGFQWTLLSFMASLAAIALGMGNLYNHRRSQNKDLLRLHGLTVERQYQAISVASITISSLMGLILLLGMVISLVIKGNQIHLLGLLGAILIYILGITTVSLILTLLSLFLKPSLTGLLGILLVLLGSGKGIISLMVANTGGFFSKLGQVFLSFLPALDTYSRFARDMFFGEFSFNQEFLKIGIYTWIVFGLLYLGIKGVASYEK